MKKQDTKSTWKWNKSALVPLFIILLFLHPLFYPGVYIVDVYKNDTFFLFFTSVLSGLTIFLGFIMLFDFLSTKSNTENKGDKR